MKAECVCKEPSGNVKLLHTAALKWSHVGRTITDKNMGKKASYD